METEGSGLPMSEFSHYSALAKHWAPGGRKRPALSRKCRPPGDTREGGWEAEGTGRVQREDGTAGRGVWTPCGVCSQSLLGTQ